MNYSLKLTLYLLAWIIGWSLFSAIINSGLILTGVYAAGEKGQVITFFTGGIISSAGAISLYKEVFYKDVPNEEK